MSRTSLFACRDARGSHWQLGPLPPAGGQLTLIGWNESPARHDGGVPPQVARTLAHAWTSIVRATFPSSFAYPAAGGTWSDSGGDQVRLLTGGGVRGRIAAKLRSTPPNITMVSTRQPDTLMRVFDDEGFPWWMQGQVIMLSQPETPPPAIDGDRLLALFNEDWTTQAAPLAAAHVDGIVRPGVDGDVAGLLTFSAAFAAAILAALENEARAAGVDWAIVPEAEFAERASP